MTKDKLLSAVVANEIKPGEELLWQGKADQKMFLKRGLPRVLVIILISIGFILVGYGHSGIFWSVGTFVWLALIIIVMQGLARASLRVKNQLYVLTSQRAMVVSQTSRTSISSTSKESLANYTRTTYRDGSGSIIFTGGRTGSSSFLWLGDVKAVSERIDQLLTSS